MRKSPDDSSAGRGSWSRPSREMSVVLACCCSSFQRGALPADGSASKYSIAKFDLNTICVPEAYAFSPRPRLNEWTFRAHFYAPAFSKAPCKNYVSADIYIVFYNKVCTSMVVRGADGIRTAYVSPLISTSLFAIEDVNKSPRLP